MNRYSCDKLGVCNGDNPKCQMCAIERETRRQAAEAEQPDVWDGIFYWTVILLALVGGSTVLGGIGSVIWRLTQ